MAKEYMLRYGEKGIWERVQGKILRKRYLVKYGEKIHPEKFYKDKKEERVNDEIQDEGKSWTMVKRRGKGTSWIMAKWVYDEIWGRGTFWIMAKWVYNEIWGKGYILNYGKMGV